MRSAVKRKPEALPAAGPVTLAPAAKPKPRSKPRIFHATVQVTRTEEWFVEAETAAEARALLERGDGQRSQIGECAHFEIGKVSD